MQDDDAAGEGLGLGLKAAMAAEELKRWMQMAEGERKQRSKIHVHTTGGGCCLIYRESRDAWSGAWAARALCPFGRCR